MVQEIRERIMMSPKAARVNANLTLADAAKIIGISVYKLAQIEYGKKMKEKERVNLETKIYTAYKLKAGDINFA